MSGDVLEDQFSKNSAHIINDWLQIINQIFQMEILTIKLKTEKSSFKINGIKFVFASVSHSIKYSKCSLFGLLKI